VWGKNGVEFGQEVEFYSSIEEISSGDLRHIQTNIINNNALYNSKYRRGIRK
jgi:hypothetical protein